MSPLSFNNQHVQRLRRLSGRRSSRQSESAFLVEGAKVLIEALDAGAQIEAVFVVDGTQDPVLTRALALGIPVHELAGGVMERITDTVTPQPILAVAVLENHTLADLRSALMLGGFVLVGVDLRDPGNAGTIIRSCEASGAVGVVLCEGCVDATNPKTVRSTAGALFHIPVVAAADPLSVLEELRNWGVRSWAAVANGAHAIPYDRCDLSGPTALLVGNEAHGLPANIDSAVDGALTIPMAGRTESLNVSMAATVLCFEAARQRRGPHRPAPPA